MSATTFTIQHFGLQVKYAICLRQDGRCRALRRVAGEANPSDPQYIFTSPGVGYMLACPDGDS